MANFEGGTGERLGDIAKIVCGVASLVASVISFLSMWLQTKNYRKPLLQRYVVRILLMVPIYSASSWGSLMSLRAALYLDPLRDIYEAFTIYTFLQLLVNFIGGERALIVMMHGRKPVSHPWPLNHCFAKVDISDPHTFLAIKRGILQYTWLKPILSLLTIIMKLTGTYKESYLGPDGGYLWIGILYNLSVSLSLYSLAMFWVCMSEDLAPFRPVPKFLCIKLIIFASYWQGFFLSILQSAGAIPNDVEGYTADNLANAIQDALICCEMPLFAISHWYAFSWHDYADETIHSARLPVKYALRDAFGYVDLVQDAIETFKGDRYAYREFDAEDDIITHEESSSRDARMREGLRYSRSGGKYWVPKAGKVNAKTPLLGGGRDKRKDDDEDSLVGDIENEINERDEKLYDSARELEFGDWNYPVITAHIPAKDMWRHRDPNIITTSTNRKLLHPKTEKKRHRRSSLQQKLADGKRTTDVTFSSSDDDERPNGSSSKPRTKSTSSRRKSNAARAPVVAHLLRQSSSSSHSSRDSSQLVDLIVRDEDAERLEQVRARKEGSAMWNGAPPKHFVKTYGDDSEQGTDLRVGYEPDEEAVVDETGEAEGRDRKGKGKWREDEDDDEEARDRQRRRSWGEVDEGSNIWA